MTIRVRLALFYAAALIATVTLVGVTVWWQMDGALRSTLDQSLQTRAGAVLTGLENDGADGLQEGDLGMAGVFVAIRDAAGTTLDASADAPVGLPAEVASGASQVVINGIPYLLLAVDGDRGVRVIAGTGLQALAATLDRLARSLLLVGGATALTSVLGGWVLAGRALRPVAALAGEAERIDSADLERRLPVPGQRDELHALAITLNRMLDRVAVAVRQQRAFIAAASHDLRTPIAALQAELDLANDPRTTEIELRRAVGAALGDAVRLGDLATALLDLAAVDSDGRALARTAVRTDELIASVVRRVAPLARHREVTVNSEAPVRIVRVDRVRLEQAIMNLVVNAISYGPAGGTVDVEAHVEPVDRPVAAGDTATLHIAVMDRGAGVPADFVPVLFEPFHRGPNAIGVGSGLGLATAAAAIRAHAGAIGCEPRTGGGTRFWITVPA